MLATVGLDLHVNAGEDVCLHAEVVSTLTLESRERMEPIFRLQGSIRSFISA